MKDLHLYIKESAEDGKNGHWEDFYDEDIDEVVTMWVDDKPEEIVNAVKEATPEELKKLQDLRKAYDKIDDHWWDVRDEIDNSKEELRALKNELREIQYGMEDEIGRAKDDAERDKLGNEYGEKLEKYQEQIRQTIKDIETLTKKEQELNDKLHDAEQKLFDYEEELGYHAHRGGKITKY